MARRGQKQPLPPPLPPETRTVGQLVAETIRFYGSHFWPSLALGIGPAAAGVGRSFLPGRWQFVFLMTLEALVLTASYVAAIVLVHQVRPPLRVLLSATAAGFLVFLPVPLLLTLLILPAVAWLALVGFVVPAVIIERAPFAQAFRRATVLARADYVHAVGSLATLAIAYLLTSLVLFVVLGNQGQATLRTAAFLSVLVLAPILFIGAALLYLDQAAREVGSRPRSKSKKGSDRAEIPAHDDADRPGRADAKGQSRQAARGQS